MKAAILHEMGHTVGLWHEQSREDRDQFVRIDWANIQAGMEHNFDQHITDGDDIGDYDYGSIMHYPATAFSSTGLPTIVALGGQPIGHPNMFPAVTRHGSCRISDKQRETIEGIRDAGQGIGRLIRE